ncbi:MAG: hypothetical protein Q7K33_01650, partial [Candidatus Berkelbacteria bacterium]|nr:hypothetical protein [Candidatus Berkelbacteria bacterium]
MKAHRLHHSAGSALLLTVMIIAILTTTTLASIAVRFDQLASTDKIANSVVAKSAADSALVKVKEKLVAGTPPTSVGKVFDLDTNEETDLPSGTYRPSPRKIVSTYQKVQTSLPRCNGVIVLLPWTNDGQYLLNQANDANPAMIFNYANIVNDTPLGIIPGNGILSVDDKAKTISQLTNMGHFYNPFAPLGAKQKDLNYWTVKLGGPQDQFLTRKSTDGVSSYYKNVDFVYLPYLPRWSDSGLFTATPDTKVDRIPATELRQKFENTIKENNFKVWIDASITDAQLYQYGFGDLFVDSPDYKLKWLQPALWNDTPEADDYSMPYKTDNAEATELTWTKKTQPLMTTADNDWKVGIVKGAKSFSFIKLTDNSPFSPNANITGFIYGSLEGLRLDQLITLQLLDKNQQPLSLLLRGQDQGRMYSVKLTAIGPISVSNGVEAINVTFHLANDSYNTPTKATGGAVTGTDLDTIAVLAPPQFSTANSINSADITFPDGVPTIVQPSACQTACPAVGDLVNLTKGVIAPVWGKVTGVEYTNNGTVFTSFTVDKLRQSPLPTREMAYTYYTDPLDSNRPKIAYYGGAIAMNDYDGGYASESDQLWIYDPEADSWTFKTPGGIGPGRRAGASMAYDNTSNNNRLVMISGYYHEWVNVANQGDCEVSQSTCLYTNRPGLRIAKRVTNDVYVYNLPNGPWEKISYTFDASKKIQNGAPYTARVTSTLADRSGLERWNMTAKNLKDDTQTLKVDGQLSSAIRIYPSTAGLARGDEIYMYGDKLAGGNFYSWGKIEGVDYSTSTINASFYGYKANTNETVQMKNFAIQVVKRQIATSDCTGVINGQLYYCLLADATGYAVGDSVVLEQYNGNNLTNTLSGFISFIDTAGQVYFVADEKTAPIKDYSDQSVGRVANDSAVAFPSPRYGATFTPQPTASTKASYWQGAAKNINYNHRFADLWNVEFKSKATFPGAASAAWSMPSIDNTTDTTTAYNFQIVRPNYTYQISTTNNSNPEIIKTDVTDPKSQTVAKGWDSNARYLLDISSSDASKVVVGAWATLERRLTDGTRETFHAIVEDTFINPPSGCGNSYDPAKLCLRHNSAYPGDSGFAADSKKVKVTMTPSFRTDTISGGTFNGSGSNYVSLQSVPSDKLGTIPGVGATVMIWKTGVFPSPTSAYTFIVSSRSYANSTFNFYYDKLTASPHPIGYSTSQIASDGTTNRLVTITDHQMSYDYPNAPEWYKDTTGGIWKIRLSNKNPGILYRPAPRRAGMVASYYESGVSKLFVAGGTFGQYSSLWKEEGAGLTMGVTLKWVPQYVSADSTKDIPNLFGGSLVAYKYQSNIKLVYFGGKQKTDLSIADYGSSIGAKMLGRPDYGTLSDNSFFISDYGTGDPTAAGFTDTIKNNPANWPSGVSNSLEFKGGDRGSNKVCTYLGQVNGLAGTVCSSKPLLSQLGNMGRNNSLIDQNDPNPYNGWTWGRSAILTTLGDRFKSQNTKASLIMSVPTLSGAGANGRWEQDGYRPYCKDNASGGCLNLGAASVYGKLAADFGSDKTAGLVAYTAINNATDKGGAILATSVGVGTAIASNRGGSTGTPLGWYSYCAASDVKKDANGNPELLNNLYQCKSEATRYLPTLPDAEDLLFTLNAAQALGATDT